MRRYFQTRKQRGFTLTEILVAISIFSIVMIAALVMYDRNSRVFKSGVENADAQQNTRVAFDKLVSDLRMIGFDYDRDGFPSVAVATVWLPNLAYDVGDLVIPDPPNNYTYMCTQGGTSGGSQPTWPTTSGSSVDDGTVKWQAQAGTSQYQQPDEQIEYAGPTAITIRGNFDYETASGEENGREALYQSTRFPVVTTANDEIVTYALVSKNTAANDDSVSFYVDMNATGSSQSRTAYPGGSIERQVTITGVDTSNANPPYTLFRITFDDEANEVRTPMADNIRSMAFQYYQDVQGVNALQDLAGNDILDASTILGLGPYDPDTPQALVTERVVRSRIKSVRLTLVGMTENPDYEYEDTTDLASLTNYRKYRLESLIVPRNIGKRGLREQDTNEPGAPILDDVGFGHCGLVRLRWTAPQAGGGVEQYAILYDSDDVGGFAYATSVGLALEAIIPIPGDISQTWYFTVAAQNSFGTTPASNVAISGIPYNRTKPSPVTTMNGTPGATEITLVMDLPQTNESPKDLLLWLPDNQLVADPNGLPAGEIMDGSRARVRIFRGTAEDFVADPAVNLAWGETSTGTNEPIGDVANATITWSDTGAAHCTDYWYRVQVLDKCAFNATLNATGDGNDGASTIFPLPGSDARGPFETSQDNPATPDAPQDLVIDSASSCDAISGLCTVMLQWPKVVSTDAGANPITIDQYNIEFQRLVTTDGTTYVNDTAAGSNVIEQVTGFSVTPGSIASYQKTGLLKNDGSYDYQYAIKVRAQSCSAEGADSPERRWPCIFTGGTLTLSATSVVDGDGSAGNPWHVYGAPDIVVDGLTASATQLNLTLYKGGTPAITPIVVAPPAATEIISLPDLDDDGVPYTAVITAMDSAGCSTTQIRYLVGSPTSCCLQPHDPPSVVVLAFSPGQTFVDVRLHNTCSTNLTLDALKLKWSTTGLAGGTKLDTIGYPPASGSTYVVQSFNSTASPITSTPAAGAVPQIPGEAILWTAGTTYATGDVVRPAIGTGFSYVATTDGTSGLTEPVFPTVYGNTVNDNGVIWNTVPLVYTIRLEFTKNLPRQPITDVCISYTRGTDAQTVCKVADLNATPTNDCE